MFILLKLFFPPPFLIKAMSVICVLSLGNVGLSEVRGNHMQYSKFLNIGGRKPVGKKILVSSRTGMLIAYTPPFLAGLRTGMLIAYTPPFLAGAASFGIFPDGDLRFLLVKSTLTFHFFKRILEVLFVHRYSGGMAVESLIPIALSYFTSSVFVIYAQHLAQGLTEPAIDLMYPGLMLFLIGISGNFYHHCLLSKLRSKKDKEYRVPEGGLFDLVICPHYLFEILGILGISLTAQTLYAFAFSVGTTLYLMGRSYSSRRWYLSQFKDFPKDVKALVPFVF
ncbi:steroid alpha-reductase DET [Salix suchowensis]|nr:steroid alpha-reductase DET [Salix suchowensis]